MSDGLKVLVTGGAGYIGSHMVLGLLDAGHHPVVLDDLSTGTPSLVPEGVPLIEGNVGDRALVDALLEDHAFDAVAHFAASIIVPESVIDPTKYYLNNTVATARLIASCVDAGISKFIFSSTAAVYGNQDVENLDEATATNPENPYGTSKLMSEMILRDVSLAHPFAYVSLRYFNVAGADAKGRSGQISKQATHLIKIAAEVVAGKRSGMQIYGTDYDTPDGTCIRDYIHVSDLVAAHIHALDHLVSGGESMVLNCGYGHGYSVREVLQAVERVTNEQLTVCEAPRRAGDAASLVADSRRLRDRLGWTPKMDDLSLIVSDAVRWERYLAEKA